MIDSRHLKPYKRSEHSLLKVFRLAFRPTVTLSAIVLYTLMHSCADAPREWAADTNSHEWNSTDTVAVRIEKADTATLNDITLFVRYNTSLDRCALPLCLTAIAPDSTTSQSITVILNIDKPARSFTRHREHEQPYRLHTPLSRQGRYTILITPSEGAVKGVAAVGIKY